MSRSYRRFWNNFDWKVFLYMLGLGAGVVGVVGGTVVYTKELIEENNHNKNISVIENNIVTNNNLEAFESSAMVATQQNSEYFLELFGTAIKEPGAEPEFTSLTYKVERNLYDKVLKSLDVEFTYDEKGNVVFAENTFKGEAGLFGERNKSVDAVRFVTRALIKVTEEKAHEINFIGSAAGLLNATENKAEKAEIAVTNITKPHADEEAKTMTFYIQTISNISVDKKDDGKISLATFKVTQPLTAEMAASPELAIANYLKGQTNFELESEEVLTLANFNKTKIQNNWTNDGGMSF